MQKIRTALFWLVVLLVMYFISRHNYNLFHSLADGVTIVIAASAFAITWTSRHRVDNHYILFLGIAFLFFAFLDLIHMLGNKDMGVFPGYGNLGPTFYIAGRYLLSISFLIAPLFIRRRLNTTIALAAYSAVTLLILLSVFYWDIFPATIVEGVGLTLFKIASDYVICLLLLVSIGLLLINRESFDPRVLKIIVYSVVLSIATGLMFTLYTDPFGITNAVAHLLQIASFYLVYMVFIENTVTRPQETLFLKLKQSEAFLTERTAQLETANKDLESFTYSVSHDLRAPLRAIDGFSGMVVKQLGPKMDDDSRRKLKVVRENAAKMNRLIDDLLNLSRMGRQALDPKPLDMEKIFREAWKELCQLTPERKARLEIRELKKAAGDEALIRQVVLNTLSNALKYTRDRDPAVIEVGSSNGDGSVSYCVKDNGAGFDMKHYDKLYGVFHRLHSQSEFEGTGVGLAIVKRIIQRHGGRVWAEGKPGEGATFCFSLPAPHGG